jgi:peptide/nickel transport system permease protein
MRAMLLRRLAISAIVVFGAVTLVFCLVYLLPGDPVNGMVDASASEEMKDNLRRQLGFDKPLHVQYFEYINSLLHGDLGKSKANSVPVVQKLLQNLPATLTLALASIVLAVAVGFVFGILSAVHRNSWGDMVVRVVSMLNISMPTFWFGILFLMLFSIRLGWFPAMGSKGIVSLILPALTLGLTSSASILRLVRSSMLEILNETYITALRAKGLPERRVLYRHALRNALIPAVTMIGLQISGMLGGAVIVETVFSRQGIGRVLSDAIMAHDIPVIQGIVLFTAIIIVAINLLVDISYALIDPRVRVAR